MGKLKNAGMSEHFAAEGKRFNESFSGASAGFTKKATATIIKIIMPVKMFLFMSQIIFICILCGLFMLILQCLYVLYITFASQLFNVSYHFFHVDSYNLAGVDIA